MILPVVDFLVQRMQEYDPTYELRPGTAFTDLFIMPLSYITQPIVDQLAAFEIGQSITRILQTPDPDAYPKDNVDALVGNLYVYRVVGDFSQGTARLLYQTPTTLSFVANSLEFRNAQGLRYTNSESIYITAPEMSINIFEEFYFVDIRIVAEEVGIQYNQPENGIVFVNDPNVIRVFNEQAIVGGVDEETNTHLLNRTKASISVRDMNTGKGLVATLYDNFPEKITHVQGIGFLYPEMMRDIYYNFHIGGRVDAWIKTPAIREETFDVTAINLDYSRSLKTSASVQMVELNWIPLGISNLDEIQTPVRAFSTEEASEPATFISYVDYGTGINLQQNRFISLSTDTISKRDINIAGATPSKTQAIEVANRINKAAGMSIAKVVTNPIIINIASDGHTKVAGESSFFDSTSRIFHNVYPGDILYILAGPSVGNYEVTTRVSENELLVDPPIPDLLQNMTYRVNRTGTYLKISTPTKSQLSELFLGNPTVGESALTDALGLMVETTFYGKGPYEYVRDIDYTVDAVNGAVRRLLGPTVINSPGATGIVEPGYNFTDASSTNPFFGTQAGDVLTVYHGGSSKGTDYRIGEVISFANLRLLDTYFHESEMVEYEITRTGILNGAMVLFEFGFNPLSIDVGNLIAQDEHARELAVRPGRENMTIKDMAYLWTESIEIIDPATGASTGVMLDDVGGFGQGGYGKGSYGVGNRPEYRLYVNKPELRFSALEDSLILIDSKYIGDSLRVTYKFVPEIVEIYYFAISNANRVLDADVLPKHFIPALVTMDITYRQQTPALLPVTDDELIIAVTRFINTRPGELPIDASDIIQVVLGLVDPSKTANAQIITPFEMRADIHNTDGSLSIVTSSDSLQIPSYDIPPYTPRPLSPRTAHWIAKNIVVRKVT